MGWTVPVLWVMSGVTMAALASLILVARWRKEQPLKVSPPPPASFPPPASPHTHRHTACAPSAPRPAREGMAGGSRGDGRRERAAGLLLAGPSEPAA